MSNLLVQTIKHTNNTSAQTIDTSGRTTAVLNNDTTYRSDSGAVTQNMVQGLTKAWCSFDGTAGSISFSDSFNCSGLIDEGTGDYTVNITNDMANGNYSCATHGNDRTFLENSDQVLVGSVRFVARQANTNAVDVRVAGVQVCGDLA